VRHFARFLALVAALLLVLPAGALPTTYYCRWMERAMSSCCCRGHDAAIKAQVPAQNELRRGACCELIKASSDGAAPSTRESPVRVDAAAIVARLPIEVEPATTGRAVSPTASKARAPPGLGPPLFLSHCSLLI